MIQISIIFNWRALLLLLLVDMGGSELVWVMRSLGFLLLMPGILGWGKEGHYAICKIAEGYLTEDAVAAVKELLPESAGGDCHDSAGHKDRCVTGAIYNYTMQLTSAYQNTNLKLHYNLTEALMFLSHFMGDLHQPLHVGFTGDEGGNTIVVRWFRRKSNLHHVWDDMIIDSALKTFYYSDLEIMIKAIQRNITNGWSDELSSWENCLHNDTVCPNPYASESISLACKFAYKNATPGSTLGDDYFLSRLPIVEKRLAQGGVRLAATLNRIFSSQLKIDDDRLLEWANAI
ncbi:endonuclease 4-like isoform X3 [Quercus robur]|uniref:endonuclease 4-like isoform X3 n=1 Tax=Quercus robur TaxID=38942 RepID=UPI002163111A|nr:endonuclease 4-like isoform X3 [Quercus robur]